MNGADAVCRALAALGVDCIFGIPSQQNLALYDAFRRHGIRAIPARHEQGAVHAADGYARATGRLGVAVASTGPGTSNALAGMFEAEFAASPVLLITTQISSRYLGRGSSYIHSADRQLDLLRAATGHADRARYPGTIAAQIAALAARIMQGRRQPGAIEIPTDFLDADVNAEPPARRDDIVPLAPAAAELRALAERLGKAKRPLLWVGGGAQDAAENIVRLAEHLDAPVISSLNGRGIVPLDHRLSVGWHTKFPAIQPFLEEMDLVIAIGTRFQAVATRNWELKLPDIVQIDVDAGEIGRNYPAVAGAVADAGAATRALLELLPPRPASSATAALVRDVKDSLWQASQRVAGPDYAAMAALVDRHRPRDSIIVCDATRASSVWGNMLVPVHAPRTAFYSTSLAIGPGVPLALGAAIGTGRRVISVNGDGGIMLSIAELATVAETRAPVLVTVFNDRGYGVLRALQLQQANATFGVDLHTPDFQLLAKSMGIASALATTVDTFEEALLRGLEHDGPFLLEVDMLKFAPLSFP